MGKQFTRNELIEAIKLIDQDSKLRSGRHSSTYDLIYRNKKYPPILVLSVANKQKNNKELNLSDFGNNTERPFKILRDNGFEVQSKSKPSKINNKEKFITFLNKSNKEGSNKANSYIRAIDLLNDILNRKAASKIEGYKSIYEINSIKNIMEIHSFILNEQNDDKGIFENEKPISYWRNKFYSAAIKSYIDFLNKSKNTDSNDVPKGLNDFSKNETLILKDDFVDWFITKDGQSHNYFSGQFSSSRERLINELDKAEEVYEQEFDSKIFEINEGNLESLIKELEDNLSKNEGLFYDYSAGKSNHRPRAIIGKKNYIKFLNEKLEEKENSNSLNKETRSSFNQIKFDISSFQSTCEKSGLIYSPELIIRYIASLATKPFVLLSGLSGSGKTKLAQAFAQWISEDDSQYCIVPVGADWTNREPLLGYVNALNNEEYILPENGALQLLIEANKDENKNKPYFLILDEMNLSHVERYFADFLSIMESKYQLKLHGSETDKNKVPSQLDWPSNLFIVGTVNIDETTYMFSPKVLDRANVIEFRVNKEDIVEFLKAPTDIDFDHLNNHGASMGEDFITIASNRNFPTSDRTKLNEKLVVFFEELKKTGAEFGYRSATEIHRLYNQLTTLDGTMQEDTKIDIAIMQKLLPKLHGSRRKLCPILELLASLCVEEKTDASKDFLNNTATLVFKGNQNVLYPLSLEKITRMYKAAIDNGFASYAEA